MSSELYGLTASQLDQLNQQAAYIARLVAESSRTIDGLQVARGIFDMTGGSPGVQPATALAVQMVKVTNGTPDGDGYYTGYWVQKDAAGLWEQQTEVRILPAGSAVLVSGKYYLAVAGLYTSTYYPIYIVPDHPLSPGYYYDWTPSVANWTTHPGGSAGPVSSYDEIHTFTATGEAGFVITLPDLSNSIQTPIHVRVCVGKLDGGSIGIDPGVVTTNGIQGAGPSVLYNITTPWTGVELVSDYYNGDGWLIM